MKIPRESIISCCCPGPGVLWRSSMHPLSGLAPRVHPAPSFSPSYLSLATQHRHRLAAEQVVQPRRQPRALSHLISRPAAFIADHDLTSLHLCRNSVALVRDRPTEPQRPPFWPSRHPAASASPVPSTRNPRAPVAAGVLSGPQFLVSAPASLPFPVVLRCASRAAARQPRTQLNYFGSRYSVITLAPQVGVERSAQEVPRPNAAACAWRAEAISSDRSRSGAARRLLRRADHDSRRPNRAIIPVAGPTSAMRSMLSTTSSGVTTNTAVVPRPNKLCAATARLRLRQLLAGLRQRCNRDLGPSSAKRAC